MFAITTTELQPGSPAMLSVLLVRLAGELYAVPSDSVREIIRHRAFIPVPGAPPALPGILNQRGTILPLVEMYSLLGLEPAPITRATRIVIVAHADIDMALLIDAVIDLEALPADSVEPVPAALDPARARLLRGVAILGDDLAALLDLDELIAVLRA